MVKLNNKVMSKSILAVASLSAMLLVGCDKNTSRYSEENIVKKTQCANGMDLNQMQTDRLQKNAGREDVVVSTVVTKDGTSEPGNNLGRGQIFSAKSASDMVSAPELMVLVKDCENLQATYVGPGAVDGLTGEIVAVKKRSIQIRSVDEVQGVVTNLEIKINKVEDTDYLGKLNEANGQTSIILSINETGSRTRSLEVVQTVGVRGAQAVINVAASTLREIYEKLGDTTPAEVVVALAQGHMGESREISQAAYMSAVESIDQLNKSTESDADEEGRNDDVVIDDESAAAAEEQLRRDMESNPE